MTKLKCGKHVFDFDRGIAEREQTWRNHLAVVQTPEMRFPWVVGLIMDPQVLASSAPRFQLHGAMTYLPSPLEVTPTGQSVQLRTNVPPLIVPYHTLGTPRIRIFNPTVSFLVKDLNDTEANLRMQHWFYDNYQNHWCPSKIVAPNGPVPETSSLAK